MAKKDQQATPKKQGRIKQLIEVLQLTVKKDPISILWFSLAAGIPAIVFILLAIYTTEGNVLAIVLWSIAALMGSILSFMIVLGRRGEKVAFQQIEGQPGAVGAVLRSALKRGWRASEFPVAVNPRTQDAVYRVIGKGGVVLISEGPASRTGKLVTDESRRVKRSVPQVALNHIKIGPDPDSIPLIKINKTLAKLPKVLNKHEIHATVNRLEALQQSPIAIPKGMDPTKMRAPKPR